MFSPDGNKLASISYEETVLLWDTSSGQVIQSFKDHVNAVYHLAFSGDGKRLALLLYDGNVKLWDMITDQAAGPTLACLPTCVGHILIIGSKVFIVSGLVTARCISVYISCLIDPPYTVAHELGWIPQAGRKEPPTNSRHPDSVAGSQSLIYAGQPATIIPQRSVMPIRAHNHREMVKRYKD